MSNDESYGRYAEEDAFRLGQYAYNYDVDVDVDVDVAYQQAEVPKIQKVKKKPKNTVKIHTPEISYTVEQLLEISKKDVYNNASCEYLSSAINLYYKFYRINITNYSMNHDKKFNAIKKIKNLTNRAEIHSILNKMLILDDIKNIKNRYFKKENIPREYFFIVQKKGALNILLYEYLKSHLKFIDDDIKYKVDTFCEEIYINEEAATPYNRVTKTKEFICTTLNKLLYDNYHKNIPSESIRVILSLLRFHLGLYDILYRDYLYYEAIERKCYLQAKQHDIRKYRFYPISYYQTIRSREHQDFLKFASGFDKFDNDKYINFLTDAYSVEHREFYAYKDLSNIFPLS